MNDLILETGDILVIPPFHATDFEALEDTLTTVTKLSANSTMRQNYLGVYES